MADFERLVQELIEAAVREGEAAATFTKPMQHYYNATHAARDALMGAIDKATCGVAPTREPLRHATKENGDCPHWCEACKAEAAARGVKACAHSWHDYGQLGGRNVSWCGKCDTLAWTGQEPAGVKVDGLTHLHVRTRHPQDYVLHNDQDGTRWRGTADGRWVRDDAGVPPSDGGQQ